MSDAYDPVSLNFTEVPPDEMRARARAFREQMSRRRSVRAFSDRPVPQALIEEAIRTAGTAPSGAYRQPWQFVAVDDPALKTEIREAAEAEEKAFYENRVTEEWEEALEVLPRNGALARRLFRGAVRARRSADVSVGCRPALLLGRFDPSHVRFVLRRRPPRRSSRP